MASWLYFSLNRLLLLQQPDTTYMSIVHFSLTLTDSIMPFVVANECRTIFHGISGYGGSRGCDIRGCCRCYSATSSFTLVLATLCSAAVTLVKDGPLVTYPRKQESARKVIGVFLHSFLVFGSTILYDKLWLLKDNCRGSTSHKRMVCNCWTSWMHRLFQCNSAHCLWEDQVTTQADSSRYKELPFIKGFHHHRE
jgi:hypothetical protein